MQSSVRSVPRRQAAQGVSFIADDYRKGYQMPDIPYQLFGIIAKELWVRHKSILRIVPGYDEHTGLLYKQNINTDTYSMDVSPMEFLSNTFYMCKTMTGFGSGKQGLIIDLPPGSRDSEMFSQSPIDYFHWVVSSAVKNKGRSRFKALPVWEDWVNTQNGGTLPYPKVSLLFQALAFLVNSRGFLGANNEPLVDEDGNSKPLYTLIVMPHKVSWMALAQALVLPLDPSKDLDAATNNKYGAMAEALGNVLYLHPVPQASDSGGANGARKFYLRPSVQPADVRGWTKLPMDLPLDLCKALWVPWHKLLKFYTASEQLLLLAALFGADTVNYIFDNNPLFSGLVIPENIRVAGKGRYESGASSSAGYSRASTQATRTSVAPIAPAPARPAPKPVRTTHTSSDDIMRTSLPPTSGFNDTLSRIRTLKGGGSTAASGRTNALLANLLMSLLLDDED